MEYISIEEFKKIDIRIGLVESAERVPNSDKLIKMIVSFGDEKRHILSAIAEFYEPEFLVGKQMPFVLNLPPRKLRGEISEGMTMATDKEGRPILLHPAEEVPPGSSLH